MVINKRSKFSRARGSWTHGGGGKKKRRGAGNRGGRGAAGSGKRGDANKPSNWKNKKQFGKYGFKKVNKKEFKPLNIRIIEDNLNTYVTKNIAKKEGGIYILDIADLGYNKLLGAGKVTLKLKITTDYASASSIEKIKNAGGEVIVKKQQTDKKTETKE